MKLKQVMFFEDFYENKYLVDFTNYSEDSRFFDPVNKKVIDRIKDELKGKIMSEFVGLKSKIYSLIAVDVEEVTKTKGVNKNVVKNKKKIMRHKMKRTQSKLHRIGTYDVCKFFLSYSDDKRYILDNGINILAYFYKDVKNP